MAPLHSAFSLSATLSDKLRSPITSPGVPARSSALLDKPLPSRPRSKSLPSTPEPAELPGSILLENQGFPSPPPVSGWATSRTMRSVRSTGNALSPTARQSPPKRPHHKKSLSETSLQSSRPKPQLTHVTSSSSDNRSTDSRLPTCSESTIEDSNSSSDTVKAHVGLDALLQPSPLFVEGKARRNNGAETPNRRSNRVSHVCLYHHAHQYPCLRSVQMRPFAPETGFRLFVCLFVCLFVAVPQSLCCFETSARFCFIYEPP